MWYGAMGAPDRTRPWWEWLRAGYAESHNGLDWRRAPVTPDGKNLVPQLPHTCCIFRDDVAEDQAFRYLALHFANSGEQRQLAERGQHDPAGQTIPGHLWTSADGLHWRPQSARVFFEGTKPLSFVPQSFFRDARATDPARRWKAYGFSSVTQTRRAGYYAYSGDGHNWIAPAANPILSPTARGAPAEAPGPEQQIHDTVVWPYGDYYLAFYQYLYGRDQDDVELAVSRDGERFSFVAPGDKVIARGGPGEWDRGEILPAVPLVVGDEVWIFYGGSDYYHPSDGPYASRRSDQRQGCAGLARLRRDRFAYFQPRLGAAEAYLTTRSLDLPVASSWTLLVNATGGPADSLTVEILDADTGAPLPGYGKNDSAPVDTDVAGKSVTWRGSPAVTWESNRRIKARFHLTGQARFYGFTWEST
ncbi:MAG: hypothetical protein HY000_06075 [Planctomycetes bacterium]|nr:hypothetical protein [Planctomycetota bacterium]